MTWAIYFITNLLNKLKLKEFRNEIDCSTFKNIIVVKSLMAKKKIITIPNPLLRKVSAPVTLVNTEVKNLMDDMLETMYAAPGIGLAAVQVGVLKRIIVIDLSKDGEKKDPLLLTLKLLTNQTNFIWGGVLIDT